jgi:hypothetical protein
MIAGLQKDSFMKLALIGVGRRPLTLCAALARPAVAALVLAVAAGCTGGPRQRPVEMGPVDQGPGTLTAGRKFLEGRWSLESFEVYPEGKPPIAVKGNGTLSYDDFGNLKVDIRADQATSDQLRAAGIDIRDGVISSEGRTAVDMQNRTLTYVVSGQTPNTGPLALNRPRHWQVEGDVLTLTTKDDSGKPLSVGRWKKSP